MSAIPISTPKKINIPTETLLDAIYQHAQTKPMDLAFGVVSDNTKLSGSLSYQELVERSEGIAVELLKHCEPGDRVVLLFHGGEEFVVSFIGCLMAGMIATPVSPVRVNKTSPTAMQKINQMALIFENAEPKAALTTKIIQDQLEDFKGISPVFERSRWFVTDRIQREALPFKRSPAGDRTAFLQYTSGSTSSPKGVMVSHRNLVAIFEDMRRCWTPDKSSVMVAWTPVYHDMGLIFGVLWPIYAGFSCYSLLPASVLQHPVRWLETVSRFRATHSFAPNFALDLCARRLSGAEKEKLDLHRWRYCAVGARQFALKQFTVLRKRFRRAGSPGKQ